MTRLKIPFSGMRLVHRQVAFLVVFGVCTLMCLPAEAQRAPAGGRAAPPAGGGWAPPAAATPLPPEAAEPEEGPPEKKYESLPVDEPLRRSDAKIRKILKPEGGGESKFATSQDKDDFDNFFNNYLLPRWSLQNDVKNLPNYRRELSNYFKTAVRGAVHDHLVDLVLEFLKKLIAGDFHPAVKINAMLMVGELNRVEQAGRAAAVPSPDALTYLIASVEDAKLSDGLRATAMVGILRHVSAGIASADTQQSLTAAMLQVAAADLPGAGAPTGRAWIAAQAVDILGILGSVGDNNAVFKALLKIVADAKLPFLVRSAAADALGRLNYSSATGINPVEAAVTLGQFAIEACKEEQQAPKDALPKNLRRRMLHRLDAVMLALVGDGDEKNPKGIASLAREPAQQTFVADLQKAVKDAISALDDKQHESDDPKSIVADLQKKLDAWLQKKP